MMMSSRSDEADARVGVGEGDARGAAPLAHPPLAREDALVDLLAVAAVVVAALAAQQVAELLDRVGHLGQAHDHAPRSRGRTAGCAP